jgi:hypothetical protein
VGFKGVPVPETGLKRSTASFASGSECLTLEFADPAPSAEFVAPAGFTVTKTGIADLAALRGEAARRGCSILEALESAQIAAAQRKRATPGPVAFAAPGCTATAHGLDDLAKARAYASQHGCSLMDAVKLLSQKETAGASVAFAAAPGCTVTQEGLDDLARARAYATKHGCGIMEAVADLKGGAW